TNAGTASGAELIAAALKEHGRALAIGSTTMGRAQIATVLPVKDIGSLRLNWAMFLTSKRQPFHRLGIQPDLCIDSDNVGRGDPGSLKKSCGRWVALDGGELSYAEGLLDDPRQPNPMSLRTTAALP